MKRTITHTCKNCGQNGEGNYCSHCGQSFSTHRITLKHLIEEVFHFFTHMEHGFGYTLKQLVIAPGIVQKKYLEGRRAQLQKPFSMFFLCATVCALAEYWINVFVAKHYSAADPNEIYFFQHYLVLEQVFLSPVYAFFSWLLFYKFRYNYAEWVVITFYVSSFFFLLIVPVNALKFFWPHLQTKWIEFPIVTIYNIVTTVNIFSEHKRWKIILLGCCSIAINYALVSIIQEVLVNKFVG